jgi:hypothetical protein
VKSPSFEVLVTITIAPYNIGIAEKLQQELKSKLSRLKTLLGHPLLAVTQEPKVAYTVVQVPAPSPAATTTAPSDNAEMNFEAWRTSVGRFMREQPHDARLPVYYPFSGADVVSAIAYFPNASRYTLTSELPVGRPCPEGKECAGEWYEHHWRRHRYAWSETARMKPAFQKNGVLPVLQHMLTFAGIPHVVESVSNASCSIRIPATKQTIDYVQSVSVRGMRSPHNLLLKAAPYWHVRTLPSFSKYSKYVLQDETGIFPPRMGQSCKFQYLGSWQHLMRSYKCAAIRNFFTSEERRFYEATFGPNNPSPPVHFGYSDGCGGRDIDGVLMIARC